jgi:hypothetical protein
MPSKEPSGGLKSLPYNVHNPFVHSIIQSGSHFNLQCYLTRPPASAPLPQIAVKCQRHCLTFFPTLSSRLQLCMSQYMLTEVAGLPLGQNGDLP